MKKCSFDFKGFARKLRKALQCRWGQVAYYGGIVLALTAIALAAERYRAGEEIDVPVLPAVELEAEPTAETRKTLQVPDGATILRAYAATPEWNDAFGLWESHEALDYRLAGDVVLSLSTGTVRTVGRSGPYGGFVEVECEEGLLRYASISPQEDLEPGMELEVGDVIGSTDTSMASEINLGAHLHLELLQGDVPVNFATRVHGD